MSARKLLVLGTHGQANVGDELLLRTFLDQLGDEHQYTVNSYAPAQTSRQLNDHFDVEVIDTAKARVGLLAAISRSDAVIFAGGSVLKELGPRTGRHRLATLRMIFGVVTAASAMGKPILMSNIGVGPLSTRRGRRLATRILNLVDLVSTRDHGSFHLAKDLGNDDAKVVRVPDAAFANKPADLGLSAVPPAPHGGLRIALNLNGDVRDEDAWAHFLDGLRREVQALADRQPVELVALPMQCRFKEDHDLRVLEDFFASLQGVSCELHEPEDAGAVAEIISSCDLVMSERLHAIVIASMVGRPVIALPYDPKVTELATELGIDEWSFPVDEAIPNGALVDAIDRLAADPLEGVRLALRADGLRSDVIAHFRAVRNWVSAPDEYPSWPQIVAHNAT